MAGLFFLSFLFVKTCQLLPNIYHTGGRSVLSLAISRLTLLVIVLANTIHFRGSVFFFSMSIMGVR